MRFADLPRERGDDSRCAVGNATANANSPHLRGYVNQRRAWSGSQDPFRLIVVVFFEEHPLRVGDCLRKRGGTCWPANNSPNSWGYVIWR